MSHSEDEDDFLSADEDVDEQKDKCDTKLAASKHGVSQKKAATPSKQEESRNPEVIDKAVPTKEVGTIPNIKLETVCERKLAETPQAGREDHCSSERAAQTELDRQTNEETALSSDIDKSDDLVKIDADNDYGGRVEEVEEEEEDEDDDDDDEEAALAERIRERNLKIARNFSVEIAKNLKASAPIPVRGSPGSNRRERDLADSSTDLSRSINPPAPPPTPALSSSFSNLNDQTAQNNSDGSPSLTSTQYSWRLPPKAGAAVGAAETSPNATGTNPATTTNEPPKTSVPPSGSGCVDTSEQARRALDRLSARLAQPEKNLFEKVADDIRNMSITGDDSIDVTSQLNALPATITDLGSTLGGWGWSGASKLLSSATQVTSQVGSVLNSIVDVTPQQQQQQQQPAAASERRHDDEGVVVSENLRRISKRAAKDD